MTEIEDFERSQEHCYAASLRYARCLHNNNLGIHEIKDFLINFQPGGALHGFGSAEMPPDIFGGKGKAKHRPLLSGGVNNIGT